MAASDTAAEAAGFPVVPINDLIEPSRGDLAPEIVSTAPRSLMMIVRGVLAVFVGAALIVVGTMVMNDVTAAPRVLLVVVGIGCLIYALGSIGKYFRGPTFDPGFWVAVGWMVLLIGTALFAGLLPLKAYDDIQAGLLEQPNLRPDLFSAHPLGTDRQGLDLLGQVIYGARVSLAIGIGALVIAMSIGSTIGLAAGFYRGKLDGFVGLISDGMLAFPPLILLLAMVAVLAPSTINILIALAILGIPTYIRLARANTLVVAQREFVLASRALGANPRRIIYRELLPNVILPLLSFAFIVIGASIVAEAGLSYLGLGIQRPTPTWGNMIQGGQADFQTVPHLVFVPGVTLFMTVFALNRIGERARGAWDPRGSKA